MGEVVATGFDTMRDGKGHSPLLPPGQVAPFERSEAPVDFDRSFFFGEGVDELPSLDEIISFDPTDLTQNATYGRYMRMHKVFVGNRGAKQLEHIYQELRDEHLPTYVSAAGWAAAESALRRDDVSVDARLHLMDEAEETWCRALRLQEYVDDVAPPDKIGYADKLRIALDLAILPLLRGIVAGHILQEDIDKAFLDCLNIAQINAVYSDLAKKEGNNEALAAHNGFGHECNALLALNRMRSPTLFVIPAMARADSGLWYRRQTHDLLVINQKHGQLRSATPVEVKAVATLRDRKRYHALIVRGKMHLSIEGKQAPRHTLDAIAAVHSGGADEEEEYIARRATDRFVNMARDYFACQTLGDMVSRHSITIFRDSKRLHTAQPAVAELVA